MLHYQPQVDLGDRAGARAEALLRWNRPGHGMVPPGRFIGVAEDTGLIVPLGIWVLRDACRRAAMWPQHIGIAVNVSPVQLRHPGFLPRRDRASSTKPVLRHHALNWKSPRAGSCRTPRKPWPRLLRLRALGIKLAMDDFGTGYSSLGYLQKFRFDKIKIDRSFISRLGQDRNADAIVRAVVGLTDALGIRAIAEGVETIAQAEILRAHGCSEAQGISIAVRSRRRRSKRYCSKAPLQLWSRRPGTRPPPFSWLENAGYVRWRSSLSAARLADRSVVARLGDRVRQARSECDESAGLRTQ